MKTVTLALVLLLTFSMSQSLQADWPQMRGPKANGEAQQVPDFGKSAKINWKIDLDGEGRSCPIIVGDKVFLTIAIPATKEKPAEKDGYQKINYEWQLRCYSTQKGNLIWQKTVRKGFPEHSRHEGNSYASETPVSDGKYVYAAFGMHGIYCFDLEGKPVWDIDLGSYPMLADWGTSSSPILYENLLIQVMDNHEDSFIVALNKENGSEVWRTKRDEPSHFGSPYLWTNAQRTELITIGLKARSYDPKTGKLNWQHDMRGGRCSSCPVGIKVDGKDVLIVGNEFRDRGDQYDGGGTLFAIKENSYSNGEKLKGADLSWYRKKSGQQMASPAYSEGYIHLIERRSNTIRCIDAKTGEFAYEKRMPNNAYTFWTTPLIEKNRLYCLDSNGLLFTLEAGPKLNVLQVTQIDADSRAEFWSTPAVSGGVMFIRSSEALYSVK